MRKKLLLFLISVTIIFSQEWVSRYNGPADSTDCAEAIAVDSAGNVYVTGYSYDYGTSYDYVIIKYNSDGQKVWIARYNGPLNGDDRARAIAVDNNGNVYVTGYSYGDGTYSDYTTIKYNPFGQIEWISRYNGPGNYYDYAEAIAVDSAGNVYVTGYSYGQVTSSDYATIKYNREGQIEWISRYNGPGNYYDGANAIAVDNNGNVYVTGRSYGQDTYFDYTTIKYNSQGEIEWLSTYNNAPINYYDVATAIAIDNNGNVYVTGFSEGRGSCYDYVTIKYNREGEIEWISRYNGPTNGNDEAHAIAVDNNGNIYVTGFSVGQGTYFDYTTIKYNQEGEIEWISRYNGPSNYYDYARAIAVDNNGNVYVTGYSYGDGTYFDYTTIKYNPSGQIEWVKRYNGPGNYDDVARAIAIDNNGNLYVTGYSYGDGTSSDYATIKYSAVGIKEENKKDKILLKRENPKIYNILGKNINSSLKNLKPGIYFIEKEKEKRKIIIVK